MKRQERKRYDGGVSTRGALGDVVDGDEGESVIIDRARLRQESMGGGGRIQVMQVEA